MGFRVVHKPRGSILLCVGHHPDWWSRPSFPVGAVWVHNETMCRGMVHEHEDADDSSRLRVSAWMGMAPAKS